MHRTFIKAPARTAYCTFDASRSTVPRAPTSSSNKTCRRINNFQVDGWRSLYDNEPRHGYGNEGNERMQGNRNGKWELRNFLGSFEKRNFCA